MGVADQETLEAVTIRELLDLLEETPPPAPLPGNASRDELRVDAAGKNLRRYLAEELQMGEPSAMRWPSSEAMQHCIERLGRDFELFQLDLLQIANLCPRSLVELCLCLEAWDMRFTEDELTEILRRILVLCAPEEAGMNDAT